MPIGANTSQPLGNFSASPIDHHMKEKVRVKCYLRYCDDCTGLAKTKAEAWAHLNEFYRQSSKLGFVMKADAVVAPIASKRRTDGKKKRKRQRGGRKAH